MFIIYNIKIYNKIFVNVLEEGWILSQSFGSTGAVVEQWWIVFSARQRGEDETHPLEGLHPHTEGTFSNSYKGVVEDNGGPMVVYSLCI